MALEANGEVDLRLCELIAYFNLEHLATGVLATDVSLARCCDIYRLIGLDTTDLIFESLGSTLNETPEGYSCHRVYHLPLSREPRVARSSL